MKCINNVFRAERLRAAMHNDSLASMDSAAPLVGMERSKLQRIETDGTTPYPDEVVVMSDTYNSPGLMYHYCSCICSIGKKIMDPIGAHSLDGVTVDVVRKLQKAQEIINSLLKASSDHRITPDEHDALLNAAQAMKDIGNTGRELEFLVLDEVCKKE